MKQFQLFTFVLLILLSSIVAAQPKIQLAEGPNFEFGDVISGSKLTKEITVKNIGTDTLHIKDVRAQCGCTATLLKEKSIPPSQESKLSVTFNAAGYKAGKVTKHVYVDSDDPTTPTLTVEFAPNVIQLLEVIPTMLSFNNAKIDSQLVRTVTIKNSSKDTINILSVENNFEQLKVSLSNMKLAPGDSSVVTGELLPTKAGSYQAVVNLLTDHPSLSKLEVKAFMWVNRK
ncbi:MAG: DUF1573 domain-containing protein [Ignavibacteriae bacterium]|nr:DUF1573 domain-containing protein [Ignavibacteriota bacterium]